MLVRDSMSQHIKHNIFEDYNSITVTPIKMNIYPFSTPLKITKLILVYPHPLRYKWKITVVRDATRYVIMIEESFGLGQAY